MRSFAFPIRTLPIVFSVFFVAACATPQYVSQFDAARKARCPEQTVLVCHEQTSLHKTCACTSRQEYHAMLNATRF